MTINNPESQPEIFKVTRGDQAQAAEKTRGKLSNEYINEIMPKGDSTLNQADQQVKLLVQQGFSDMQNGQASKGLSDLLRATQLDPALLKDKNFTSAVSKAVHDNGAHGDKESDNDSDDGGSTTKGAEHGKAGGLHGHGHGHGDGGGAAAGNSQLLLQAQQLVQMALSDATSGHGTSGIAELMQALSLDPTIVQNAQFSSALQAAFSGKGQA